VEEPVGLNRLSAENRKRWSDERNTKSGHRRLSACRRVQFCNS
jgi:hypothetical protein